MGLCKTSNAFTFTVNASDMNFVQLHVLTAAVSIS